METSEWLQVIAGFGTFFVVLVGVTFGGLQLRQEARARRLQSISSLFTEIWPTDIFQIARTVGNLPDDLDPASLTEEQTRSIQTVATSLNRLGYYLHAGLVTDKELFEFTAFGLPAIKLWVKVSRFVDRVRVSDDGAYDGPIWYEHLAQRAQNYWLKNQGKHIAKEPIFMPDVVALEEVLNKAYAARRPANGAAVPEAAA